MSRHSFTVTRTATGHQSHAVTATATLTLCGEVPTEALPIPEPSGYGADTDAARQRPTCRRCAKALPASAERVA